MTLPRLVVQLGLAVGVMAAANVAVWWLSRNSVPRQVLARGRTSEPATDLFLGNSTMAAGLDEAAFSTRKPGRPLNLALGASSPVEHLLILRQQGKHHGADVYYGFFDLQLTDRPSGGWKDLVGNRAMAYYVEPEVAAAHFSPGSWWAAASLRAIGVIPMLAERSTVWSKVELLRRALGGLGLPPGEVNEFGRVEDFARLDGPPDVFADRCRAAVSDGTLLNEPVRAILAHPPAKRVVFVHMPVPSLHRQTYYDTAEWNEYLSALVRQIEAAGGVFVPASDWVPDSGFRDPVHMNEDGARLFSTRLAEWVSR